MALAHVERDEVRGAYNAALYLSPRRRMLADWAGFIQSHLSAAPVADDALAVAKSSGQGRLLEASPA
ncbi:MULTISPECIES: hypothetical protein [unclassified Sphingomonas]|uniref:hypothetical protein n=1 Tax=unclassified Sphingomonas TaxID=196159 RepID=UPI00286766DA|nr:MULTISPECIES: hypothetical protein [unclassified Sphingomonas]MDR6114721.1 hypothetical protein [Sphingomonas sp. SORGH_AS_0789]MDR6151606.1 hypothetical protein [Sphingomonas sp. SORGH_AS_0742]